MNDDKLVMSNFEIEKAMKDIGSRVFKGVIMQDQIKSKVNPNVKSSFVINYDEMSEPGSHWVSLFIDPNYMYYFDSYGIPPLQAVSDLALQYQKKLYYNDKTIQPLDSVICGELAVSFIALMEYGHSFHDTLILLRKGKK